MKRNKFKMGEAIVFDPTWWNKSLKIKHPLKKGQIVYFLSDIPNVFGHCIVATYSGKIIPMVHPEDFRKAKEEEL